MYSKQSISKKVKILNGFCKILVWDVSVSGIDKVLSLSIRYFLLCANFFFYGESITDYINGNPNPPVDDESEVTVLSKLLLHDKDNFTVNTCTALSASLLAMKLSLFTFFKMFSQKKRFWYQSLDNSFRVSDGFVHLAGICHVCVCVTGQN